MKHYLILSISILCCLNVFSQNDKIIKLSPPNTTEGMPIMEAFSLRASGSRFNNEKIALNDLSGLLWAGNGVNRPEKNKRTAPSAFNAQDIDIYVFNTQGIFLYLPKTHALLPIDSNDYRELFDFPSNTELPSTICLLVTDISRFKIGEKADKMRWAYIDAGLVAQNILLFCSANKIIARPRTSMNIEKIQSCLHFKDTQYAILNILLSPNESEKQMLFKANFKR